MRRFQQIGKLERIVIIIQFLKKLEKLLVDNSHYRGSASLLNFLHNDLNYLAERDDKAYSKFGYNQTTALFFAVLLENYTMQAFQDLLKGKSPNANDRRNWCFEYIDSLEGIIINNEIKDNGSKSVIQFNLMALMNFIEEYYVDQHVEEDIRKLLNNFKLLPANRKSEVYQDFMKSRFNTMTDKMEEFHENLDGIERMAIDLRKYKFKSKK